MKTVKFDCVCRVVGCKERLDAEGKVKGYAITVTQGADCDPFVVYGDEPLDVDYQVVTLALEYRSMYKDGKQVSWFALL